MRSKALVLLSAAASLATGLTILIAAQAVESYPSADGFSLASGQLLGGDFVAFYVGGRLFDTDRSRLYDLEYQRVFRSELLGPAADALEGELPYVYPPLVAALISPFSRLPFQRAFLVWTLFGFGVGVLSLILLMHGSGASQVLPLPLLLLFCLGFVPFSLNTVLGGQVSWLGMAILAGTSTALLRQRDYLAGTVMSLSYYKPPLFTLILLVLCLARGKRFILGFASGATILIASTLLLVGLDGTLSFLSTASRYVYGQEVLQGVELPPEQGMGIVALMVSLPLAPAVTLPVFLLVFLALAWLGYRLLRHQKDREALFGLIFCGTASLALSVQLIKYDLALLLVPMILGVAWYGKAPGTGRILPLLPFVGFYFEFPLRHLSLGGTVLNASSLLFLVLLIVLSWQGWRLMRSPGVRGPLAMPPGPYE